MDDLSIIKSTDKDFKTIAGLSKLKLTKNVINLFEKGNKKYNKKGKNKYKTKSTKKQTISEYCKNYKYNILGKENKNVYDSCKINQYCRKYKCNNIDHKFDIEKNKKLGNNNNLLLMSSIYRKCPVTMSEKNRKRCFNKATKTFYDEMGLGNTYNKVIECNKKICAKENKIFHTNIYRLNKTKKIIRTPKLINIEDLPDQEMIETN